MPHVELPQAEFKVVLLGDTHTGKTSLVMRFVEGSYRENRSTTVGAFFLTKRLTILDTMTCKLLLWDTAGQEQFQKLAVTYYKQAAAAIVCFDVSDSNIEGQVDGVTKWLDQIQQNIVTAENRRIVICIVACKSDLPCTPGLEDEIKELAQRHGALYIKTSAKKDYNVHKVFVKTAEMVLQCQQEAVSGHGRPIPVTMGGATIQHHSMRSSSGTSPRNVSAANSNVGGGPVVGNSSFNSPMYMVRNNSLTVNTDPSGPSSPHTLTARTTSLADGMEGEATGGMLPLDGTNYHSADEKKDDTADGNASNMNGTNTIENKDSSSPTSSGGLRSFICDDGLLVCGGGGAAADADATEDATTGGASTSIEDDGGTSMSSQRLGTSEEEECLIL